MSSAEALIREEKITELGVIGWREGTEAASHNVRIRNQEGEEKRRGEKELIVIPRTTFLLVSGPEGGGKTTTVDAIERMARFVVVDKDDISDIFTKSRKNSVHKDMRPMAYELIYAMAERQLRNSQNVIIDAPFHNFGEFFANEAWVRRIHEMAESNGADVKVIWCDARPLVKLVRMRRRASSREYDRTATDIRALAKRRDVPPLSSFKHLRFDTEKVDREELKGFLLAA